jgi:hypothetical protein
MLSAITNRGRMAFMVFTGKFISSVFILFLERLISFCISNAINIDIGKDSSGSGVWFAGNISALRSSRFQDWRGTDCEDCVASAIATIAQRG